MPPILKRATRRHQVQGFMEDHQRESPATGSPPLPHHSRDFARRRCEPQRCREARLTTQFELVLAMRLHGTMGQLGTAQARGIEDCDDAAHNQEQERNEETCMRHADAAIFFGRPRRPMLGASSRKDPSASPLMVPLILKLPPALAALSAPHRRRYHESRMVPFLLRESSGPLIRLLPRARHHHSCRRRQVSVNRNRKHFQPHRNFAYMMVISLVTGKQQQFPALGTLARFRKGHPVTCFEPLRGTTCHAVTRAKDSLIMATTRVGNRGGGRRSKGDRRFVGGRLPVEKADRLHLAAEIEGVTVTDFLESAIDLRLQAVNFTARDNQDVLPIERYAS